MKKILLQLLYFINKVSNKLINHSNKKIIHLNTQGKPSTKIISTQYPQLGIYFFYRKISTHYAHQLEQGLKQVNLSQTERLRQVHIGRQSLFLFNIFACLGTAVFIGGGVQALKNTAIAKFNLNVFNNSGEDIAKSLIPLFILNKLSKFPK